MAERRSDEPGRAGSGPRGRPKPSVAEIFGDVLPDVTGDERDPHEREDAGRSSEAWYRENRPPHHG